MRPTAWSPGEVQSSCCIAVLLCVSGETTGSSAPIELSIDTARARAGRLLSNWACPRRFGKCVIVFEEKTWWLVKRMFIYAGRHHHMNIQLKTRGSFWVWNSNSWGGGREISFFLLLIIIRGIHDSEGNLPHSKVKSTRVAQSTFVDWNRISLPWRWALSPAGKQ